MAAYDYYFHAQVSNVCSSFYQFPSLVEQNFVRVDQMANWQKGKLIKWQIDEMASCPNASCPNLVYPAMF
jgi:hypothetical protein